MAALSGLGSVLARMPHGSRRRRTGPIAQILLINLDKRGPPLILKDKLSVCQLLNMTAGMSADDVNLLYGRSKLSFRPPSNAKITVFDKSAMPGVSDPGKEVDAALANPIGCPQIQDIARALAGCRGKNNACILVCDKTRPVPNHLFLQKLVSKLMDGGIRAENICIIVATGLHRPNEGDELQSLIGDNWIMKNIKIFNHFANDEKEHTQLGLTSRGTPIALDKKFLAADVKIVSGLTEPHIFAGYSGGRKIIAPGIAQHDMIRHFHNYRMLDDPMCKPCVLDGNPLHEDMLEVLKMISSPVYAVNTVLTEERKLAYINFGDIVQSHLKSVEYARRYSVVQSSRKYRTVVTCCAGYPLDQTYYQAIKGMVSVIDILEDGGNVIIAAECKEGLGSSDFQQRQKEFMQGHDAFMKSIASKPVADTDQWMTHMIGRVTRVGNVMLYSELSASDQKLTGAIPIRDISSAISASISQHEDSAIAVIPEGPYVVPMCTV